MKTLVLLFTLLLGLTSAFDAGAQAQRHPRVIELEKSLSQEALDTLKGRFPNKPFIVTVSIDPLMREQSRRGVTEKLPYYDLKDEEIVDEWDDPALSSVALLSRVRKIVVNVSIPSSLGDDEVAELKQAISKNLSLLDARDAVEIQKRQWSKQEDSPVLTVWLPVGLMLALFILAGLWAATWFGAKRLSSSLQEGFRESNKTNSNNNPTPLPAFASEPAEKSRGSGVGGDIRFSDPIKMREILHVGIQILKDTASFPNFEDMGILDNFAKEDPSGFGAFLSEFPFDTRKKLFSYSSGEAWLWALSEPGEVRSSCIDTLNKCLRVTRNELQQDWQELLILIWRLDDRRSEFFKGLPQADAFSILAFLPRALSLKAAREVYPGAWGVLLDPQFSPQPLKSARIQELKERAFVLVPLRDIQVLERFKSQKDLLGFLKTADPQVEKEIYQASPDQYLSELRPAFYPVFELAEEKFADLVPRIKIEDWALAMFNVSRQERKLVEACFSDKQKFRYFELLKGFDSGSVSMVRVGEARERVAAVLKSLSLVVARPEFDVSEEEKIRSVPA